jgi:hypothetical protein
VVKSRKSVLLGGLWQLISWTEIGDSLQVGLDSHAEEVVNNSDNYLLKGNFRRLI